MNYHNEFDKNAAAWTRQLIADGLIPPGEVDERSITDVTANDLRGYTQCHFFGGISGWSLALQLAGWPADRPVWTGSCPCQPFSVAGKGKGTADERHLWPHLFRLIRECRPDTVFGEQVASPDALHWLDGVCTDLESENYAVGAIPIGAHSVGAPHQRNRLYWVADAGRQRDERWGINSVVAGQGGAAEGEAWQRERSRDAGGDSLPVGSMADCQRTGLQGHGWDGHHRNEPGWIAALQTGPASEGGGFGALDNSDSHGEEWPRREEQSTPSGCDAGFWSDSRLILCRDGKARRIPTQSEIFPLADGLPYKLARRGSARPAILKGAGNAIVPQVAALFIQAFLESKSEIG